MPFYKYKARSYEGKKIIGIEYANDIRDLQSILKNRNLKLDAAKEKKDKKPNLFFSTSSKIKKQEVITFIRQLAVMVSAGVSIVDAIDTLKHQTSSKAFKVVLIKIYDDLLKGIYLSDAFSKYPKIFPSFFKNMVYIGEISGSLDFVLNKVADYYERDAKMKAKAKGAMTYPMFLFFIIVFVFVFLTVYIVPQFEEMLREMGGELPKITQVVVSISSFMKHNYLMILGILFGTIASLFLFFKTKPGKYFRDFLKLKAPFLKPINYSLITSRFSRGLGVLIGSGMHVMDNKVFEKKFSYAIDEVKRGRRIARSIDNINFFPKMLIEMILVGESTGSLDKVLEKTADYYDDQLEKTIVKITSALEPLLIVFAGVVVAVVILSIFLPMISIMDNIN